MGGGPRAAKHHCGARGGGRGGAGGRARRRTRACRLTCWSGVEGVTDSKIANCVARRGLRAAHAAGAHVHGVHGVHGGLGRAGEEIVVGRLPGAGGGGVRADGVLLAQCQHVRGHRGLDVGRDDKAGRARLDPLARVVALDVDRLDVAVLQALLLVVDEELADVVELPDVLDADDLPDVPHVRNVHAAARARVAGLHLHRAVGLLLLLPAGGQGARREGGQGRGAADQGAPPDDGAGLIPHLSLSSLSSSRAHERGRARPNEPARPRAGRQPRGTRHPAPAPPGASRKSIVAGAAPEQGAGTPTQRGRSGSSTPRMASRSTRAWVWFRSCPAISRVTRPLSASARSPSTASRAGGSSNSAR